MRLDRRSWHPNRSDNHNHFYLLKLQKDRFIDHVTLMITHITAADVLPKDKSFLKYATSSCCKSGSTLLLLVTWLVSKIVLNLKLIYNSITILLVKNSILFFNS